MSKDRPKYLHVSVFLNSQEEVEEFFQITEIREAPDYDLLELVRNAKVVAYFEKQDVLKMEVKADA